MMCKTCKFWRDGYCERVEWTDGSLASLNQVESETFEIQVNVADDHGLKVKLRTGPDFGCVLHARISKLK